MKIKDLNNHKDAESELLKILSEELARNIDREILKSLGIDSRSTKIKRLLDKFKSFE
jgi:hypothetical protein